MMKILSRFLFILLWAFLSLSLAHAEELDTMLEYVNNARNQAGLPSLEQDEGLYEAAAIRARELSEVYGHTRPNGADPSSLLKALGVSIRRAGENIARGDGLDADEAFANWMRSPGHRRNIMSPEFEYIGIGRYQDASGKVYWVQLFVRYD